MWGHCSTRILLYFIWTVNKFFQAVNVQKIEQCCPNCIFSLIHFTVKNKVSGIWSDGIRNQLTQFKYLKSNTPAGNASRPQIHFLLCMSERKTRNYATSKPQESSCLGSRSCVLLAESLARSFFQVHCHSVVSGINTNRIC